MEALSVEIDGEVHKLNGNEEESNGLWELMAQLLNGGGDIVVDGRIGDVHVAYRCTRSMLPPARYAPDRKRDWLLVLRPPVCHQLGRQSKP